MYRTPPRRAPRVAPIATTGHGIVALVLDPWEVRSVLVTRSRLAAEHLLLRERPAIVATSAARARWLARLPVPTRLEPEPRRTLRLDGYPELRRFEGTRLEKSVRQALTLAEEAMLDLIAESIRL